MSATADSRAHAAPRAADSGGTPFDPVTLAWIALLPCGLAAVAGIWLLGPPLGHLLLSPGSDRLWPSGWWEAKGHAEPAKHARYLLALLAPLPLVATVLLGARRRLRLRPRAARLLVLAAQAVLVAYVAALLLHQNVQYNVGQPAPPVFGLVVAIVAGALVLLALAALRRPPVERRLAALVRETPARRTAALALAVAFLATWLLKVPMTDRLTGDHVGLNLPYTMDDASAVMNGLTPIVDYHVVYAKLLPYPTALVMDLFGATIFVFTTWMATLNLLALTAVYATFRRLTHRSLLALALLLPFVATSDLGDAHIVGGAITPMTFAAMWPMRYGGAYLMAWLAVRHLTASAPRRAWLLFLAGGLVAIDDLEFGAAALLATLVALLCAKPPRSLQALRQLAGQLAAGLLAAGAGVCVLTLTRSGSLPDPALLLEWPRVFTTLGWFSLPLPTVGLHLAIYATFVGAVVLAAVRVSGREEDTALTGMLAWSGVFGLLAGGYLIGRPDTYKIDGMLSAWCFALALLAITTVRALAARGWRRPAPAQLLVLFGCGLAICSLRTFSPPTTQIARLTRALPEPAYEASVRSFVGPRTRHGETVALLVPMGHRIAEELGLRNVAPYAFMNAIVTRAQMQTLLDVLQRRHVRQLFTAQPHSGLREEGDTADAQLRLLGTIGFRQTADAEGILELTRG